MIRLCPKIKIIALHVPASRNTFRQVLRVGAYRNICLVASDDEEEVLGAAKIANYLEAKQDRLVRPINDDFQQYVTHAGRF
jgi:hypothetical protein